MKEERVGFQSEICQVQPDLIEGLIGRGEGWRYSLSRTIVHLHDGTSRHDEAGNPLPDSNQPPKIIFITATSAIPHGFAIKECWRWAYPLEKPPAFIIIDVSTQRFGYTGYYQRILTEEDIELYNAQEVKKLRSHGERLNAFTDSVVFDESTTTRVTLRRAAMLLKQAGFRDISFCAGHWDIYYDPDLFRQEKPVIRYRDTSFPFRSLVIQNSAAARRFVKDMKKVGRLMAEEIKLHGSKI